MPYNPIRVISLDFDGALSNGDFVNSKHDDISLVNQALLTHLRNTRFSENILFIGSNRQSYYDDCSNAWKLVPKTSQNAKARSCYPYFPIIAKAIDAVFNPFLMTDLYHDRDFGKSYELAMASEYVKPREEGHETWLFDNSKSTIIYAQMQLISNQNPKNPIEFHFYDDSIEILHALVEFYATYPALIPMKVTLKLYRYYDGKEPELMATIEGVGEIDINYKTTVKEMAAIAIEQDGLVPFKSYIDAKSKGFEANINPHLYYRPNLKPLINPIETPSPQSTPKKGIRRLLRGSKPKIRENSVPTSSSSSDSNHSRKEDTNRSNEAVWVAGVRPNSMQHAPFFFAKHRTAQQQSDIKEPSVRGVQ